MTTKPDQKTLDRMANRLKRENEEPLKPVAPEIMGLGIGLATNRDDLAGMVGGLAHPESESKQKDESQDRPLSISDLIS